MRTNRRAAGTPAVRIADVAVDDAAVWNVFHHAEPELSFGDLHLIEYSLATQQDPERLRSFGQPRSESRRSAAETEAHTFRLQFFQTVGQVMGVTLANQHLNERYEQCLARVYARFAYAPASATVGRIRLNQLDDFLDGLGGSKPLPSAYFEGDPANGVLTKGAELKMPRPLRYLGLVRFACRQFSKQANLGRLPATAEMLANFVQDLMTQSHCLFLRNWGSKWEALRKANPQWRPSGRVGDDWDWVHEPALELWLIKSTHAAAPKVLSALRELSSMHLDINQLSEPIRLYRWLRDSYCANRRTSPKDQLDVRTGLTLALMAYACYRRKRLLLSMEQQGAVSMGDPEPAQLLGLSRQVEQTVAQSAFSAPSLDQPLGESSSIGEMVQAPTVGDELSYDVGAFYRLVRARSEEDYGYLYYCMTPDDQGRRTSPAAYFAGLSVVDPVEVAREIEGCVDRIGAAFVQWAQDQNIPLSGAARDRLAEHLRNGAADSLPSMIRSEMPSPELWSDPNGEPNADLTQPSEAAELAYSPTLLADHEPFLSQMIPAYMMLAQLHVEHDFVLACQQLRGQIPADARFEREWLRAQPRAIRRKIKTQIKHICAEVDDRAGRGVMVPYSIQEVLQLHVVLDQALRYLHSTVWTEAVPLERLSAHPTLLRELVQTARQIMHGGVSGPAAQNGTRRPWVLMQLRRGRRDLLEGDGVNCVDGTCDLLTPPSALSRATLSP